MKEQKRKILINKYLPIFLNLTIFLFSSLGFIFSCVFAVRDGYSHWLKRLLYFTQQSNLWIGVTSLIFAIFEIKNDNKEKQLLVASVFKFIFTVSITITGIIFCSVLAPFADFDIWNFATVVTHVVVPVLSIIEFFVDKSIVELDKKFVWYSIFPPLIYFIFAGVLGSLGVDFGRGDTFPYFFMNFSSEVGLFGFINSDPPQFGSVYWLILIILMIYLLSFVYLKIRNRLTKKAHNSLT